MILAKFLQEILPKCKIWVGWAHKNWDFFLIFFTAFSAFAPECIHQIVRFCFKNTKFSSFWGDNPLDTPCVQWYTIQSWTPWLKNLATGSSIKHWFWFQK